MILILKSKTKIMIKIEIKNGTSLKSHGSAHKGNKAVPALNVTTTGRDDLATFFAITF